MNALFIYRNCYTGGVSGGDTHTDGVCEWLIQKNKMQVYIIRPLNDGQEKVYPAVSKVKNILYRSINLGNFFALTFLIRAFLGTFLTKLPYSNGTDLLVASSHFLPDVLPVFFKGRDDDIRAVYIHHIVQDMERPKNLNNQLANMQEKICFYLIKKRFHKIIVVNSSTASALRRRGFSKQEILVSTNFVNFKNEGLSAGSAKPIDIVFCGRMVPQKGVKDFIYVCKQLAHERSAFSAVMLGTGPMLNDLRDEVKRSKLNVIIPGFVNEEEKVEHLRSAKLFVFPSREEGWGIAIAESLTAGTPVIAYDLPVYHEVFNGKIELVGLNDKQALVECVSSKLSIINDRPLDYVAEQKSLIDYAHSFARDEVAASEINFLYAKSEAI